MNKKKRRAIIGGTGIYEVGSESETVTVKTPYGEADAEIVTVKDTEIVFLPRHGKNHNTPPHLINYRANMSALKQLGVTHIYATCAVGSMNPDMKPASMAILTDFIDFTKTRPLTFHDGKDGVKHTDMSDPYCGNLRQLLISQAEGSNVSLSYNSVYVCTEGPRFETAAEIKMYRSLGGDLVGMTNVPEVVLAKELGMCYAAVGIVTNWCTGIGGEEIAMHDIKAAMDGNKETITKLFLSILSSDIDQNHCSCASAVMTI